MAAVSTASPTKLDPVVDPRIAPDLTTDEAIVIDTPWVTIVWNDPVNLMSYVTFVFTKYFGYSKKKSEKLMLEVHEDGRSVVSSGSREEMERDVQAMHEYGLWATLQKAD
jgi:ATP-dependent Clp protease adaptor protein ClpS